MAQAIIWIPARVADTQPVGGIPDAVAGNGDTEKRVPACINGSNEPSMPCRTSTSLLLIHSFFHAWTPFVMGQDFAVYFCKWAY